MIMKHIMLSLIIFFSSFVCVYSQPTPEDISRKHDRIIELIKQRHGQGEDVSAPVARVQEAEAVGRSFGGIVHPVALKRISSLLDEAEQLLNQADSSRAIKETFRPEALAVAEKLDRIKQLLQERAKKDGRIPLVLQEIGETLKLKESGKPKEALESLEKFRKKWQIKNIPLYYSAGDSIGEEISVIFKGEVSPTFIKEAHYIGLIVGKVGETEKLIRSADFTAAKSNMERLEKMVKSGPANFSGKEKEELYKRFKDFYAQAAQKYFTHNLTEPLTLIENLYQDLPLGYLNYEEITKILNQASAGVKSASLFLKQKQKEGKLVKVLSPHTGAVFGMWNVHDLSLLPQHSQAQGFLNKTGQKSKLENIVLPIQYVEGDLHSLDDPLMLPVPGESYGLKIGPTTEIFILRTWASAAIPAIEFHLHEHNSVSWYLAGFGRDIPEEKLILLQDIIDGKIDDYLERQAEILKKHNRPLMFRTINEFNAYAAIWPVFGRDGRTSLFDLVNGDGTRRRIFKAACNYENVEEIFKQIGFESQQVYNNYGYTNIPDGPERIRDTWKHIHDIFDEVGAKNITWVEQAAPEHGAPNPLFEKAKNWDRMHYYWPGRNYVDWGGISGYNEVLEKDKNKRGTLYWTTQWWRDEIDKEQKEWGALPNILYEFAQTAGIQKKDFENWIKTLMSEYLPGDFKNIKAINWITENIPLDTKSEIDTFKKYVTNNPYCQAEFRFSDDFIAPARISDLTSRQEGKKIILSWTAPGDDINLGRVQYYVIKYRANPIDNSAGVIKDFRSEPWRLWSRYETKDIEGEPKPAQAGMAQSMEIDIAALEPSNTYYFGIQSVDDAHYNSRISNIAEVKVDKQELDSLNSEFMYLLKETTPSWDAVPAVIVWWEAKVAKEKGEFELAKQKLEESIKLISNPRIRKVSYDEILDFAGAKKNPIEKGKLQAPENGAYTGHWQAPAICSPLACPEGSIDKVTNSHSALVFDVVPWYNYAPAYLFRLSHIDKFAYLTWESLFSFEDSFLLKFGLANNQRIPLIISTKQYAELLAQYGSVLAITWNAGYITDQPSWAGGSDYHPELISENSPKIQDILDGKWDDYIRKIAREIKNINAPLLIELTHEFNVGTMSINAPWSFGKNGDESFLKICNPQLTEEELTGLFRNPKIIYEAAQKGIIKTDCPRLYDQYGNPDIPDGPERQKDMWIHVKGIFDKEGVTNVAWFEHTGDKFGTTLLNVLTPWNKLDYYWPGEGSIDFLGTSAYYDNYNLLEDDRTATDGPTTFFASARLANETKKTDNWKNVPVLLLEFAYTPSDKDLAIKKIFGDVIPNDSRFKSVKGFTSLEHFSTPPKKEEISAWKTYVSENPYYVKYPVISGGDSGP